MKKLKRTLLLVVAALWLFRQPWAAAIGLGLWFVIFEGLPLFTYRGRRLLVSRYVRLTHWEYWPMWVVYPPVLLHVLLLAARHGGIAVLKAVNPGFPTRRGREVKSDILARLAGAGSTVAQWALIGDDKSPHEKADQVRRFMTEKGLSYPIILKPDFGLRSRGVAVCRSDDEVRGYLHGSQCNIIAQEYVPGVEYGIFYCRYPSEERGRIVSITDKRLSTVTADGRRTLEHLILDDRRGIGMASFFIDKFKGRLDEVPPAGKTVKLTEVGAHCRGATFHNGEDVLTEALEAGIDEISKHFEGFYFGRYDIRAASREDIRAGRGLRVIELNGFTAEAVHIYDPENTLRSAYRTLRQQWRTAFEIASENVARGDLPPLPPRLEARLRKLGNRVNG